MIKLLVITFKDELLERMRQNFAEAIAELQKSLGFGLSVLAGKELADGVLTPIAHKLGRAPVAFFHSPVRNATSIGRIEEVRDGSYPREQYITVRAIGYGGTVTVDVAVV